MFWAPGSGISDVLREETAARRAGTHLADTAVHVERAYAAGKEMERLAKICSQGLAATLLELNEVVKEAPGVQKEFATAMALASKELAQCGAPEQQKQEMKTRLTKLSQESMKQRMSFQEATKLLRGKLQVEEQLKRTEQLEAQLVHLQELEMRR